MKISYNWLKNYIDTTLSADKVAVMLTDCGLEVESTEKFQSLKGGLEGLIIAEVKSKEKHPDADRLSITTVDVGIENPLHIVCGAPNVEVGQKVVVAMVGAVLYPTKGESFEIKKSKIRGQLSEGMICAEDEIGLGNSHEGIMILDANAKIGTPAAEYFKIENDFVFEIGLTPNRVDAASHIGVARDLAAVINQADGKLKVKMPSIENFKTATTFPKPNVEIIDSLDCPRYSGILISDVKVGASPKWLKNKLVSIGLKSINNVVDITNFVLYELGQPLHAFDADKIKDKKIIVKKAKEDENFTTLDGVQRKLSANDLMICDTEKSLCIAGVLGGLDSGINEQTKNIFLESAYFNPMTIRKTAKRHGIKTDASFRFERGTDPNVTVYALKRAALLIQEIADGKISSAIFDNYPKPMDDFKIELNLETLYKIIGKKIERDHVKNILQSLEIKIISENENSFQLAVSPYKVDVQREIDVIEEVLRIYGYNQIESPTAFRSSLSFTNGVDNEQIQNTISDLLTNNGFFEIMSNSLTKAAYYEKNNFKSEETILLENPLSADLNAMRQTLLYSGLETIVYNQNRKNSDVRFYEFGKVYRKKESNSNHFKEEKKLALFISGQKNSESWNVKNETSTFYQLKGFVNAVLDKLGIPYEMASNESNIYSEEIFSYKNKQQTLVEFGKISKSILKEMDINQAVFYADFNWDVLVKLGQSQKIIFSEISKFPSVRRDLALLLDKKIKFSEVEKLAYQTEKEILKNVHLFDVYEGEKIGNEKKSYAISFILQNENATLTDKQIEKTMEKLTATFVEKLGAVLR
ncbi:MAG TPA: phenylalanine--tRNA ligase subunit beta [Bacteroidia bacterium]|nr:phenylalanine--tRNA ligase subunit beta [Bacteroidia bacterium]